MAKNPYSIFLVAGVASLAGLLFGFDTGIISGALLFIQTQFHLSTVIKEIIVASVLFGAIIGSVTSGRLTDKFGRRGIILVISLIFIFGTLIASFAPSVLFILIGRLFIGIAIGIGSYTAPLYIAEAAPFELRGGLVSLNQLMITIGIMASYFINYSFAGTQGNWRFMFAIGIIPAVLLGLGMLVLPESPRWLIKQGKENDAEKVLKYFRGQKNVSHELSDIKNSLLRKEKGFKDLFAPWIRPVLFLGLMLGFLQQITGINTIIYYAPSIFHLSGFHSATSSILATAGVGTVNVIATIVAIFYLDSLGRRPLLMIGLLGMGFSLFCLSALFTIALHSLFLRWFTVICLLVYIASFAISLGAMLWLVVAEIFPLEIRGAAMGVAVAGCWLWNLIVSGTFLSVLNHLGPSYTFLFYAFMCVFALWFCYRYVPETKGVSLETIENNIHKGLPLRELGQPIKSTQPPEMIREV